MAKVFIYSLKTGYTSAISNGFKFLDTFAHTKPSDKICIKPNLTFPTFRPGVMTNPEALEALIKILLDYTNNITICESDSGGYNRFSMDKVFQRTGVQRIVERYGVRIKNLSHEDSRKIEVNFGLHRLKVPLPKILLDETDLFITMPVPKIHMNTGVSLSLKNQWGVIQDPSQRLKLHPYFNEVIYAINKAFPKSLSIIDGRYGLTRSGPMKGDVVDLNWLLMSDNLFAADFMCCFLMRIEPFSIPHLKFSFLREEMLDFKNLSFNCDPEEFRVKQEFYLKRAWTDYPGLLAFRSRFIAYVGYESFLAEFLHWILYRFRDPFYDYHAEERMRDEH